MNRLRAVLLLPLAGLAALLAGCGSHRVTQTTRSGIEQQLLVQSMERAIAQLDTSAFDGRRVVLELFALTADQAFTQEFLTTRLRARGVDVVKDVSTADLRLKVFATILGVDKAETLLGVPALHAPIVQVPIPEIALFKWIRNRGLVEFQIFAFDTRSDRFFLSVPEGVGRAKYDEFTILLVVSFTSTDLDRRPFRSKDPPPGLPPADSASEEAQSAGIPSEPR